MTLENLKKALKEEKVIFGTERTMKMMKNGKVKEVIIAINCKEEVEKELNHNAEALGIKVIKSKENSEELGVLCKKPFAVSVLCY